MIYYISGQIDPFLDYNTCTIEDVVEYCRTKKELGVDTETSGMFNHSNKVIMLQIGDLENQFVIDTRTVDISPLAEILENEDIVKIFWNAKFDYVFIRHSFGIEVKNIYDGFLVECLLTRGHKGAILSLGGICERDLGVILDKEVRNKFVGLQGRPFTQKQIKYGAEDVEYLIKIKNIQASKLKEKDLKEVTYLENNFVGVLGDIEYNGFYVDNTKWLNTFKNNKNNLDEARQVLDNYVINNGYDHFIDNQLDLFSNDKKCTINWDSSKQVIPFLNVIGINTRVIEKGIPKNTCEEKHLRKFKHEFIDLYLAYKGYAKAVSTYGVEFLKNVNPVTGRVHSNYWQILNTGRISSSEPNLQNIPSTKEFRGCFVAEEGNTLIISDYSQQEPRVTADKCKDPALIDFYLNGDGDTHSMVASKMFSVIEGKEVKITKGDPRRQTGKILNLKLDYGGSAYTVKDDLGVSEEEAQVFIDALKSAFPKKEAYFNKVIKETFKNGYILIDNFTKRKWFLPEVAEFKKMAAELDENKKRNLPNKGFNWSHYYKTKGKIERLAKNAPIQGTSGSMTKVAAILFKKKLQEQGLYDKTWIVNLVHDEIVVECKLEIANEVAKILSESMENAGKYFCSTVPMIAEAVISDYWTH